MSNVHPTFYLIKVPFPFENYSFSSFAVLVELPLQLSFPSLPAKGWAYESW